MDDDEEVCEHDFANFFVSYDKTSEPIQDKLTESINTNLCLTADKTMLSEVVQKLKRLANILNLRHTKLNQENKIKRARVKVREARLCKVQTCLEKGIGAISRIVHEAKSGLKDKHKVSAKDIYNYTSDSMKLLMTAHKDMSQMR